MGTGKEQQQQHGHDDSPTFSASNLPANAWKEPWGRGEPWHQRCPPGQRKLLRLRDWVQAQGARSWAPSLLSAPISDCKNPPEKIPPCSPAQRWGFPPARGGCGGTPGWDLLKSSIPGKASRPVRRRCWSSLTHTTLFWLKESTFQTGIAPENAAREEKTGKSTRAFPSLGRRWEMERPRFPAPRFPISARSAAETQSSPGSSPFPKIPKKPLVDVADPSRTHGGHAGVLGTLWKSSPGTEPLPSGCSCPGAWQGLVLGHGNWGSGGGARGGGAREEPRGFKQEIAVQLGHVQSQYYYNIL